MALAPLPSRDAILSLLSSRGRPLHPTEISSRLRLDDAALPGLVRYLDNLAQEGVLAATSAERFSLAKAMRTTKSEEREGTLSVHAKGFGFVRSVGHADDLFIPENNIGGALHKDIVVARFVRRTAQGSEGEIIRVVRRGSLRVAGVLRRRGKSAWLEPDDSRVRGPIVIKGILHGSDGDAAVVTITRYPTLPDENPEGELVSVLGAPGDPQVEVAKILVREAVDEAHPEAAVQQAATYGTTVKAELLAGREDLTAIPLPTIDPEDARDHDDAVWVERREDGGFTAWVAIADVSEYVTDKSPLDESALARGCSIYLPTRAIPMLPPALSSNLCSLLPDEIRLCLCAIVTLSPSAVVTDVRIVRGFMKSAAKLTYGGVARALGFTQKPPRSTKAEELIDGLRVADTLSQMLRTKRMRRGALDFQLPEPKVILDKETEAPIGVERRSEDPGVKRAYELIEELMLLANEVVATFLVERKLPAIFRVHAPPDEGKLENFVTLCEQQGLAFDLEDAKDPKKLSTFLKKIAKHPKADVLSMLLLRSMKQASYDTANIGHFGLASTAYLHFTSPIRRYPDLVVHRIVKRVLQEQPVDTSDEALKLLKESAEIASNRERHAMDVEREVLDLYRALYMRGRIGESFEGTVTGMVGSGVFVTLDAPFVEVLVRADALGRDSYVLDDEGMRFVAKRSGDTIALGDRMMVTVDDVQILRRTIYGWRHAPDYADKQPLRQPVMGGEGAEPPRKKRSDARASAETPRAGSPAPRSKLRIATKSAKKGRARVAKGPRKGR